MKLDEWQTALQTYQQLHKDCKRKYGSTIAAGISRAQYELKNYHEASVEGCGQRGDRIDTIVVYTSM